MKLAILLTFLCSKYNECYRIIKSKIISLNLKANALAQILNLGSDCGLGTSDVNKITGGTKAKKGNWGWQV
jgi:hypothetical protein